MQRFWNIFYRFFMSYRLQQYMGAWRISDPRIRNIVLAVNWTYLNSRERDFVRYLGYQPSDEALRVMENDEHEQTGETQR